MTKETKKRVIIEILGIIAIVVFVNIIFHYDFDKGPIPELSDEEVSAILDAYQLPEIQVLAIHVVFFHDDSISMAARMRISRSQLNKVIQESWMKSHRVELSEFCAYRMMFPTKEWWHLFPLQTGDEAFELTLEHPQRSYPGYIEAVVRQIDATYVDLYIVCNSDTEDYKPIIVKIMKRGRSVTPPIPSQTHTAEIKKGNFEE